MTDITSTFQALTKDKEQQLAASRNKLQQEGRWLFLSWKEKQRQESTSKKQEAQTTESKKTPAIALALEIQHKIEVAQHELQRLGKLLSKRFSAFDDGEVSRILAALSESITEINQNLKILDQLIQATAKNYVFNEETAKHLKLIMESLQGRARRLAVEFQSKQDLRVKNLENQSRISSVFVGGAKPKPAPPRPFTSTPQLLTQSSVDAMQSQPPKLVSNNPQIKQQQSNPQQQQSSQLPSQSTQQTQQLQVQISTPRNDQYSAEREGEINRIQKTVEEVAGMYRTLADYVWMQREPIESIYNNVAQAEKDVEKGQDELLVYRSKNSSNRGLIMKLLGTLIFFIMIFFMFL